MNEFLLDVVLSVFESCAAWKHTDDECDQVSFVDMVKVTYLTYMAFLVLMLPIGVAIAVFARAAQALV